MARKGKGGKGMPGGLGGGMLQQIQKMQEDMLATQQALGDEVLEVTAGGGVIKVRITGHQKLVGLEIDPEAVDPEDLEMLQDLIIAAVNEAIQKSQEMVAERMSAFTGGLNIPGLL